MSIESEIYARLSGGLVTTPFSIELTDAAGKVATGYIGTIATGLTLGPELITNGGMEAGDPPTGWDAVATPETFERSGVQKKSGSYSLHLVDSVPSYGQGRQYFGAGARTTGNLYRFLCSHYTVVGPFFALFSEGDGTLLGNVSYADLNAWFDRTAYYTMTVTDNTLGFVTFWQSDGAAIEFYLDDVSVVKITEPADTAVHIVSTLNGTTRNWASKESGFDPNTIASWKIYDLSQPGFYITSTGSTFNRGDFSDGNAFFWSSLDLSDYAGIAITGSTGLTALVGDKIYPLTVPEQIELPYVTISIISDVPEHAMGSDANIRTIRLQVSCWADTYDEAKAIEVQVKSALSRYRSGNIKDIFFDSSLDLYDGEEDVYHVPIDFIVFYYQ